MAQLRPLFVYFRTKQKYVSKLQQGLNSDFRSRRRARWRTRPPLPRFVSDWRFVVIFWEMGQSRPLFVLFLSFSRHNFKIQLQKSVDGVLGMWTWGQMMVGMDKTTELWRSVMLGSISIYFSLIKFFLGTILCSESPSASSSQSCDSVPAFRSSLPTFVQLFKH